MRDSHLLVHHFLEKSAERFPEKIAVIHDSNRVTYSELNAKANRLAWWLKGQGVKKGDRVALLLENSPEYIISYYAVLKAGAIAAPLNTGLKSAAISFLLNELKPAIIISSARFERVLRASDLLCLNLIGIAINQPKLDWNSINIPVAIWTDVISGSETENSSDAIEPSCTANIIFTTGSTGKPKGAMLSHHNIVSNVLSICESLDLNEHDIQMVVLPFFYVMGKSLLNTHIAIGGTLVINNTFAYPATVLKQMIEEKVTGFSGVPSTFAYLLHRSPLESYREKLVSLRYCSQAGGHMPRHIKEKLRQVLPDNTKIYIMYGATEASARLTCLPPELFMDNIESIGKPLNGVVLRVLGENGNELNVGENGELVASGPNIMLGYWKNEKDTITVLSKFGYHTGDLGYRSSNGLFYVHGRKDEVLKVSGHRINLQEIEDAIVETDSVIEAAIVGIPDEMQGNRLVAIVVPKNESVQKTLILSKLSENLPAYKLPKDIIGVKSLPKHANGKVDRAKCLEIIENKLIKIHERKYPKEQK